MRYFLLIALLLLVSFVRSQIYAPAAGQPGTTAIHKDSMVFVAWSTSCAILRGWIDASDTSSGKASVGDSSMALGKAQQNGVVSLGDGGSAVCAFDLPIRNGVGFDFAVFENSIDDSFLELAFVEVSSDGKNFFRFPSHSLTDTLIQTGAFGTTDPGSVNNLAGKYRSGFGTPFDLQEMVGVPGLDVNRVTHVKIVDVVGSLQPSFCSRDALGNKVNDPWPTPFPSSGFDLDAVGVIHHDLSAGIAGAGEDLFSWHPNPVNKGGSIHFSAEVDHIEIADVLGNVIYQNSFVSEIPVNVTAEGIYYLRLTLGERAVTKRLLVID